MSISCHFSNPTFPLYFFHVHTDVGYVIWVSLHLFFEDCDKLTFINFINPVGLSTSWQWSIGFLGFFFGKWRSEMRDKLIKKLFSLSWVFSTRLLQMGLKSMNSRFTSMMTGKCKNQTHCKWNIFEHAELSSQVKSKNALRGFQNEWVYNLMLWL